MSSRLEALVTPSVLRWAREKAKLSIEEAAAKIKRPVEEIIAWEEGAARPSLAQARKTSEVYKRPLAVFYLPEPPRDFQTLRDFRTLPDTDSAEYSPELALLIRQTHYRQEWMRDFLESEGVDPLGFVGSASLAMPPRAVALDLLQTLDLSPDEQKKCSSRYDALRLWIDKSEAAGMFVFRQANIASEEGRGFVLSNDRAPFIFVNSNDSDSAQIFTLAHELAHLWLNESGISNDLHQFDRPQNDETARIEVFCNRVAAEAILEEESFREAWQNQNNDAAIEERILSISGTFKVSQEVVARRLLEEGVINRADYQELREVYQDHWRKQQSRKRQRLKDSEGGPSYYSRMVSQNGYAFTRTVIGAYAGGAVSGRDASELLQVKVNNLSRLAEKAGMPAGVVRGPSE